jgi:hypothetical protein
VKLMRKVYTTDFQQLFNMGCPCNMKTSMIRINNTW